MRDADKSVGCVIAKKIFEGRISKLLYCTETVVALTVQSELSNSSLAQKRSDITTALADEVHNRSAQSALRSCIGLSSYAKVLEARVGAHERYRRS